MREYPKKGCACGKARCSCSKGKMRSSKVQSFAVGGGVTPMERTMEAPASPMGGPQTKPAFGNKMPAFAQPSAEPKPSKYMQRFQRKAAKFGMV